MGILLDQLKVLCETKGLNYVGSRGDKSSPVCCVAEAPGADEDTYGLPLVGASGKLLDNVLLPQAGFANGDCWYTNPYKVRPPNNEIERLPELGIPYETFENAFIEELSETRPRIIIALGATPTRILCPFTVAKRDDETKIGRWRGSLLTSALLGWEHYVIPCYHPAFILRDYSEKETTVFVLARAFEELEYFRNSHGLRPLPERELLVEPSYDTAFGYLTECLESKNAVSIDIELLRRKIPYTISFAKSPSSAISICLWDYPADRSVVLWRLMDKLLQTKRQIGQNYTSFDLHWLEWLGFSCNPDLVDDTRIRHNVLWPELSHKLEFMTMQYTREPYYKDEGHGWSPRDGKAKLMRYNCKDAAVTYEVFLEQEKEFASR